MELDKLNYFNEFDALFKGVIPRHFLHYCIYSLSYNDPAHDLHHVYTVCKTGLGLFDHYRYVFNFTDRDRLIVMVGCLMHDIGCRYTRKYHHITGHGLVYEYIHNHWPGEFNEQEIAQIANCVLEHRSSGRYKPTSLLSEIVSIADTGEPNLRSCIARAMIFSLSGEKGSYHSKEDVVYEVYQFLIDKYGTLGYHWSGYPEMGRTYFKEEWEVFSQQLDNKDYVTELIDEYYTIFSQSSWSIMK